VAFGEQQKTQQNRAEDAGPAPPEGEEEQLPAETVPRAGGRVAFEPDSDLVEPVFVQASMWKTTGAGYRLQPPTGDRKTAAATGLKEDRPLISQERYGFSGNK
jgi:hypothetical protein